MEKGKLIVIEGQGFTGKTTQAKMLVERLKDKGVRAVSVRHPGGTEKAERIRQELFEKKSAGVLTAPEEANLIFEALESLVREVIIPALNEGTWVICTRYSPSAFVYQGFVGGMDLMELKKLSDNATQHLKPDLIILLDLTEEEILKRLESAKDSEKHVYNEQEKDLIKKRREGFLTIAKDGNWHVVSANRNREEIAKEVWGQVASILNLNYSF